MALVCYTDDGPHKHDYELRFTSQDGHHWYYHFNGDQVHDVIRRAIRNYRHGYFTEGDLDRINLAIADILEMEKLPPVTVATAIGWKKWVDTVTAWWCCGK